MRTGAGIIYNPADIMQVYSVALGPVVGKDRFLRENKSKDRRYMKDKLIKANRKPKKDNDLDFLKDDIIRTIDLIA